MQTVFDQHKNNFDFLRLAFSTLVIFSHCYPLGTGSELTEPFNLLTGFQVTGGHIAVDAFFIISGFLITASYERSRSLGNFLKKRVLRIYPAFIVVMLLELFFVLPMSGGHMLASSTASRTFDFCLQTLRLQEFHTVGIFPNNPTSGGTINGSVWSIQYEFWCYIGVALLGITGLLRSNRNLIAIFIASMLISVLFAVFKWTPGGNFLGVIFGYPPFWARLLPMYLAGVVFYRIRGHLHLRTAWIVAACVSLLLAAMLPYGWTIAFPISGTFLILTLAFHRSISLNNWSRYGDLSYGAYLYAYPVQQLIMHFIGHAVAPWLLFSLALPISLTCAFLSWHLVEKWFLGKSSRSMDKLIGVATQP